MKSQYWIINTSKNRVYYNQLSNLGWNKKSTITDTKNNFNNLKKYVDDLVEKTKKSLSSENRNEILNSPFLPINMLHIDLFLSGYYMKKWRQANHNFGNDCNFILPSDTIVNKSFFNEVIPRLKTEDILLQNHTGKALCKLNTNFVEKFGLNEIEFDQEIWSTLSSDSSKLLYANSEFILNDKFITIRKAFDTISNSDDLSFYNFIIMTGLLQRLGVYSKGNKY